MCCQADWKREIVPDHKVSFLSTPGPNMRGPRLAMCGYLILRNIDREKEPRADPSLTSSMSGSFTYPTSGLESSKCRSSRTSDIYVYHSKAVAQR